MSDRDGWKAPESVQLDPATRLTLESLHLDVTSTEVLRNVTALELIRAMAVHSYSVMADEPDNLRFRHADKLAGLIRMVRDTAKG